MRVLMISKACIVGMYQRKLEELAALPAMELTVLVPPRWHDSRGEQPLERVYTRGYELRATPVHFNGHFHWHYYPRLAAELAAIQPDVLHMDEEPYNFATRHALALAHKRGIPACFFTWQNLRRTYPPPFRNWEHYAFKNAAHAIAGVHAAATVLRSKGYTGPLSIIPQFGIDPDLFRPAPPDERPFTIGYAGGLVPEKGIDLLIRACAQLSGDWRLLLAGDGEQASALWALAESLGIGERVRFRGRLPSTAMPAFYHELDAFVLPSRTRPNWMEQFGRVLVEAMASAVPVVGSDSGEIPHVIADAGRIFAEEDESALVRCLRELQSDPALRRDLGQRGRTRALDHYTQAHIAAATYAVYQQMLGTSDGSFPFAQPVLDHRRAANARPK